MNKLRAVSLFSNCGAGDLGYRNAGFRFDVMAELDHKRLDVCLLNHPEAVGVPGDLRKTWKTVIDKYREKAGAARPALLCACPPCQGMSSARSGKGSHDDAEAGSKDERNLLVTVVARVALALMPSLLVVENVPAFFTRKVHHPKDKQPVSAANYLVTSLAKHYVVFPLITDLCDFGVPQSRKRAFLTFVRRDLPGLKRLLRTGSAPFPPVTHAPGVGEAGPIPLLQALESFDLPSLDAARTTTAAAEGFGGFHFVPVWDERIYAMVAAIPPASGRSAWDNEACQKCGAVKALPDAVICSRCKEPLLRPIVREANGTYRLVKGFKSSYRRMHVDRPAATITTASGHLGSDYTIHPTQNRLLSPLECALLQTFPDNFKWGDALRQVGHTNVREMIGEAVPPAFTKLHGEVLSAVLKRQGQSKQMSNSDERCLNGWAKLASAARKDGRADPRVFFENAAPLVASRMKRKQSINSVLRDAQFTS
ncbi:DNA cytosine methyltransferase [Paraburkholderia sediminicola]|jgi:DNA (cytosine-5)-methyltransferase 1|nr:DNA cytosine methyltransferase [Paraburkholderia sediminicola]